MVNLTDDFKIISTRKEKLQNKRLLSHLRESDADFMIAQSNHETQAESRANTAKRDTSLYNTKGPNQPNGSQVHMHTIEKNIFCKVRSEMDSVMTTVEIRVQDAVMRAIENLVIPRVELAMMSVVASSGHGVGSVVLDLDQRGFSGIIESLQ